ANGTSIIFVSHKLDEMIALCDEVAVLRDGVLVARDPVAELTPMDIAGKMVGRSLTQVFPPKTEVLPDAPVQFDVKDLSSADGVVKHVSFSVRKGEILGLAGLAGAGRTELAETICGLRRRNGGKIQLNGKDLSYADAGKAFSNGISYLSEDRQGTALLTEENLIRNTTLASLKKYLTFGFINGDKERVSTEEYIQRFRIKCDSAESLISSLSGGNQQKVAIAQGLDPGPRFFIFDEPTRGVDVGARREIYDFIHELAESGVSCLLISSDLEEVIGNCTRVLVMHNGTIRGEVTGADINEEEIIYYATGVK
ncbi:MAG: sugar ABC transporter ATP-binding protein, partial [Lentisphaeria bacterium]|nr:sugar ABC transporter ATP-binding protein [Lentisphaeria bacterium]